MTEIDLLLGASLETLILVLISTVLGLLVGIPLGVLLFHYSRKGLSPHALLYESLSMILNIMRSIPFVILIVLMIPLTRLCVGTSIGVWAASLPLSLAAILLTTRATEDALSTVGRDLIEIGQVIGSTSFFILTQIVLFEALPLLVANQTNIIINLIGFSAMAGMVGGGGLGDLAIRYGYQRYDFELLFWIVVILVVLVQGVQYLGSRLSQKLSKDA